MATAVLLFPVALVCLVPFNFMPWAAIPLGSLRIPLHYALMGPIGLGFLSVDVRDAFRRRRIPPFVALSLVLLAAMAVSAGVAASRKEAISTCAGFLIRNIAIGWFALIVARDPRGEERFRRWLPVLGAVVAIAALFEPLTGHYFIFQRSLAPDQNSNELFQPSCGLAIGAIGQPLPLAALLNMFFPFALWEWQRRRHWLAAVLAVLILLGIFMTFRRSGYAVAVFTLVMFAVQFKENRLTYAAILGAVVIFMASILAVPSARRLLQARFDPVRTIEELRSSHRTQVYGTVIGMARRYPLLGIGTRQYARRYTEFVSYNNAWDTPDNQYLRFLAEGGLVGFGTFLAFLGYTLRRLWQGRVDGAPYLVAAVGFVTVLVLLDGLYWPATGLAFFAIAGAGVGRLEIDKGQRNDQRSA